MCLAKKYFPPPPPSLVDGRTDGRTDKEKGKAGQTKSKKELNQMERGGGGANEKKENGGKF